MSTYAFPDAPDVLNVLREEQYPPEDLKWNLSDIFGITYELANPSTVPQKSDPSTDPRFSYQDKCQKCPPPVCPCPIPKPCPLPTNQCQLPKRCIIPPIPCPKCPDFSSFKCSPPNKPCPCPKCPVCPKPICPKCPVYPKPVCPKCPSCLPEFRPKRPQKSDYQNSDPFYKR